MGTRLYLIRHGQTQWNAINKFQGHSDVPLSSEGIKQAENLAKHIKNLSIDAVYTSDLMRAVNTAEILLTGLKIPINQNKNLREINFGQWEGFTLKEIKEKYQETVNKWWHDPLATPIPGGEKLSEVAQRAMDLTNNIIIDHPNQNVMIVCHGGVIRSIICKVIGIDLNQYWRLNLDNCSISTLYFPDGTINKGVLELFNYTAVLEDIIAST